MNSFDKHDLYIKGWHGFCDPNVPEPAPFSYLREKTGQRTGKKGRIEKSKEIMF